MIIEGAGVSRHHAQVEQRHNRYVLRDLGSTHGTQVNGQPIQEVVLRDGDIVTLGGQRLVFHITTAPVDDAPTTPSGSRPRGA
jgi:pSer/pThr/pTyr-binding forkhead associated (FHA) protein